MTRTPERVIGLDVHQAQITACAILEEADGKTRIEQHQLGAFKKDRRALAAWAAALNPDEVVLESTGIYWKSPYAALEVVGIRAKVVNARHVRQVPGCKTDVGDAQWLATLTRAGLLRGSFLPPAKLRELRVISRQIIVMTAGVQAFVRLPGGFLHIKASVHAENGRFPGTRRSAPRSGARRAFPSAPAAAR